MAPTVSVQLVVEAVGAGERMYARAQEVVIRTDCTAKSFEESGTAYAR